MTRIADQLAHIELAPDEPTLDAIDEEIKRDIETALGADDSQEEETYNSLTDKLKMLSLREKIKILEEPYPDDLDSKWALGLLRSKTVLVQGTENNVVRADESVMRKQQVDALLPVLLESLKKEQEKLKSVSFRRVLD